MGWIGVDLDHTLALYESGMAGLNQIGKPVPRMLRRVKGWLKQGREVRIMTARVNRMPGWDHEAQRKLVENWCLIHVGQRLQVTNEKDLGMIELWDDRAVRVEADTGRKLSPSLPLRAAREYLTKNG
jgi:hypothetical protein